MLFILSLVILLWLLFAGAAYARQRNEPNRAREKARKEEKSSKPSKPSRPDLLSRGGGRPAAAGKLQRASPSTGSGRAHRELVERRARREAR